MLSRENLKDIQEINEIYLKGVKFHYISNLMEILTFALLKQKVPTDLTLKKNNSLPKDQD
jgi:ATP-dependent Lon protease